jgi:hypothetical protein
VGTLGTSLDIVGLCLIALKTNNGGKITATVLKGTEKMFITSANPSLNALPMNN